MMTPIAATSMYVRVRCDKCLAERNLDRDEYFAALQGRRVWCSTCGTMHAVLDRRQRIVPVEHDRRVSR